MHDEVVVELRLGSKHRVPYHTVQAGGWHGSSFVNPVARWSSDRHTSLKSRKKPVHRPYADGRSTESWPWGGPAAFRRKDMIKRDPKKATWELVQAAQLSRRSLLKASLAAGAVGTDISALRQACAVVLGRTQSSDVVGRVSRSGHPEFREGDRHQGQPDAVLAERRADQQAPGDRRRRLRPLPADAATAPRSTRTSRSWRRST